ncbi:15713_t:CDS:2 [Gigaspora margarita]|uniref:15713_t:CDS:1 n=1 Tax=Gigaspora margarita TaxID=4874 RepID=A0ABN7WPJ7_GIGMA|nr:15713_t:CDS:2 [Gigaspora margarita]
MFPQNRNIAKKARTNSTKVWRNLSISKKLIVIYYFERAQNNKATTRQFDIETKQVHDWKSKRQKLLNTVRFRYNQWMINNSYQFTPAGRIRKPSDSTLAQWVGEFIGELNVNDISGEEYKEAEGNSNNWE